MSEIEEIIKQQIKMGVIWFPLEKVQILLSTLETEHQLRLIREEQTNSFRKSLEKEEQAHTMDVWDLNMKIAEVGIALEKANETILQLREAWKLQDELWKKEKERADNIEKHYIQALEDWNTERDYDRECFVKVEKRLESEKISVNELSLANQELVEKVRLIQEHADKLGEIITNQTSKRLELEERAKELAELVKIQNDTITFSETRINEAEAQLASIKADPSIGKLIVEVSEDNILDD